MNLRFLWRKNMLAGLGLVALSMVLTPAHALVFQWQENVLPVEDMRLLRVAASSAHLIAIGRVGNSPDLDPIAATSTNGLDWQIVDIGLAGRFATDIIHGEDGFIVALDDGSLRIGDLDTGWNEVAPPADLRLQRTRLIEHQGRLLLFGSAASDLRTSRIIALADFQTWSTVFEQTDVTSGTGLSNPASIGSALALLFAPGPPSFPARHLGLSSDGSTWELFESEFTSDTSSIATRQGSLFAVTRDAFDNAQPLHILRRGPADLEWQQISHPEIIVEAAGPMRGGAPGLVLRATLNGQQALLTSVDGSTWTRQGFTPTRHPVDFVAWRDAWVGVGETALRGQPQGSVAVPALSTLALLLLAAGLAGLTAGRRLY
ncbi:MAG: hypothetical protein ABR550_12020 [Wenzhouxiangellaceae bacterium]